MTSLPLLGRRILVTRAAHQAGKLSDGLRALGAEPVEVPVLEIRPPASFEPLDKALRQIESYDWLILTSANAVRALAERADLAGVRLDNLKASPKVAVIGDATAKTAQDAGMFPALKPKEYVAESLVAEMAAKIFSKRVLLARAAVARDVIPEALRAAGAQVEVVDAYQNALPAAAPRLLREAVAGHLDAATFTSSSSVTHLAEAAAIAGGGFPLEGVPAVSIGPVTSQTLRELGWEPAAEADPFDIPGLIAAVVRVLGRP